MKAFNESTPNASIPAIDLEMMGGVNEDIVKKARQKYMQHIVFPAKD